MTRLAARALLATILVASPAGADTLSGEGRIPAGGAASVGYVAWMVEPESGAITEILSPSAGLTAQSLEALAIVPEWIRGDLADLLSRLSPVYQASIATAILGVTDPLILDEVAYAFAYLTPEQLEASLSYLDLVVEGAELIYAMDPLLDYVTLVEEGEGDNWYTTAEYVVLEDGVSTSYELPRDAYYAYVVHPVLTGERLLRVLPAEGMHGPGGISWRSYSWSDDAARSYERPRYLDDPARIEEADLAAMDFGGPAARTVLTGPARSMNAAIRDAASGDPVLVDFAGDGGGCCSDSVPNPEGHVLATTIALERAAAAGDGSLLLALLGAGPGNTPLRSNLVASTDLSDTVELGILVVRDRVPYGLPSDPVQDALVAMDVAPVDVIDSAGFATLELVTTSAPLMPAGYVKIVVPSDQPMELYAVLSDRADDLHEYVRLGGSLELHADSSEDWTLLSMPMGIDAAPFDGASEVTSLEIRGFPLLSEVMQGASYLWDGEKAVLAADRAFDPGEGAVARAGWWVMSNMPWRVAEMSVLRRSRTLERSDQPARILYNHYGNCGELHYLFGAALRTVLVPAALGGTTLDDHVWNEFFEGGRWHPLQATWSGGNTRIDDWGVAYDADTGNSKVITAMVMTRGDGLVDNVLGRYPVTEDPVGLIDGDYSRFVTLRANVVDADGAPVDGARVLVISHYMYDPAGWYVGTWGITGPDGAVDITVGEGNDYRVAVSSPLGPIPPSGSMLSWISAGEAAAGSVFERTFAYDGMTGPLARIPVMSVTERPLDPPDPSVGPLHLAVDVRAGRELAYGENYLLEYGFREPIGGASVDVLVVDEANFALLEAGTAFEASVLERGVSERRVEVPLDPAGPDLFVVVANPDRVVNSAEVSVEISTFLPADEPDESEPEEPDASEDADAEPSDARARGGCGCSITGGTAP